MENSLLDGMLAVTRGLRGSAALDETLRVITDGIVDLLGFGAAAVNVVTPEGDLRVEAVVGPPSVRTLLGTRHSMADWTEFLEASEQWGELRYYSHKRDQGIWERLASWTPPARPSEYEDAWHPDDSLFAPLYDRAGALIGVLSVDEPVSGRVPTQDQRTALEMFAAQASRAIVEAMARVTAEDQRADVESRWRLAFEHNPTAAALVDGDGRIVEVNHALCGLLGYTAADLAEMSFGDITHPDDMLRDVELFAELVEGARDTYAIEKRYVRSDGSVIDGMLHVGVIRDATGAARTIIGQITDQTERKLAQRRLAYQHTHDLLTGLPNHASVTAQLSELLDEGRSVAVLFCDVDRFTAVNEGLGRSAGDELLVEVARRLARAAGPDCTIARVGDDAFIVLAPGYARERMVLRLSEQIMQAVREPFDVKGEPHTLSLSIGAATSVLRHTHADELVAEAEHALRRAKRTGRARVELYDPEQDHPGTLTDLRLVHELREAIDYARGLELHQQPIIDVATGVTVGGEALIRWRHPQRGLLTPSAFIPMAEHAGLIADLGWYSLGLAARLATHAPFGRDGRWLAVNVSGTQLGRGRLPGVLRSMLRTKKLSAASIHLEITETALVDASRQAVRELQELADMGISVALDDFGTGYSSLSLLHDLPIDVVKIDRSFVAPIADSPRSAALVRSVVTMCRDLGITTVAEGIETQHQFDFVADLGCDLAQGYLIGAPRPFVCD